jgi:hypothetical protein
MSTLSQSSTTSIPENALKGTVSGRDNEKLNVHKRSTVQRDSYMDIFSPVVSRAAGTLPTVLHHSVFSPSSTDDTKIYASAKKTLNFMHTNSISKYEASGLNEKGELQDNESTERVMLFQPYTYISPTYRFIIVHYTSHT